MANERLKGHLDLLLLRLLADGPAHGYEVVVALRDRSSGTFDLPEGTVYPALHRLEGQGLLASSWDVSGARRRRVYHLTSDGHRALERLRGEWQRFVRGMTTVLGSTAAAGTVEGATA